MDAHIQQSLDQAALTLASYHLVSRASEAIHGIRKKVHQAAESVFSKVDGIPVPSVLKKKLASRRAANLKGLESARLDKAVATIERVVTGYGAKKAATAAATLHVASVGIDLMANAGGEESTSRRFKFPSMRLLKTNIVEPVVSGLQKVASVVADKLPQSALHLPEGMSLPDITVPDVTLPTPPTLPHITLPIATLPNVTLPDLPSPPPAFKKIVARVIEQVREPALEKLGQLAINKAVDTHVDLVKEEAHDELELLFNDIKEQTRLVIGEEGTELAEAARDVIEIETADCMAAVNKGATTVANYVKDGAYFLWQRGVKRCLAPPDKVEEH